MPRANIINPQSHLPRSPVCTLLTKALLLDLHRTYLRFSFGFSSQILRLETRHETERALTPESYGSPAIFSP